MFDVLIDRVKVLDMHSGEESLKKVGIKGSRIAAILPYNTAPVIARKIIDGKGAFLFPGFIDFHTHLFQHGSGFGMDGNQLLAAGITTAVDMGTAGYANYPAFHQCDVQGKKIRIRSFLNLSPIGQPGKGISEPMDRALLNLRKMEELLDRYPGEIVGIKIRTSANIVGKLGLEPLQMAVKYGETLGLPVCVHTTNPPASASAVAEILRSGDIYCHLYHAVGRTILDTSGHVEKGVLEARERGVLFDLGNGKMNFNFAVAEAAMGEGLYPDFISSDSTPATFHKSDLMWDLPRCMSKLLYLGMPLTEVLRSVTETPAEVLGLGHRIGKVAVGYEADLTLCRMQQGEMIFGDSSGAARMGKQWLEPEKTLIAGRVIWEKETESVG